MDEVVVDKFPAVILDIAEKLVTAVEEERHAEASYLATQIHSISKAVAQNESGKALEKVRQESFGAELVKEVNEYLEGAQPGGYV